MEVRQQPRRTRSRRSASRRALGLFDLGVRTIRGPLLARWAQRNVVQPRRSALGAAPLQVREFARRVIAPYAEEIDRTNAFPTAVNLWKELGDFGLLGGPCEYQTSASATSLPRQRPWGNPRMRTSPRAPPPTQASPRRPSTEG